MSVQEHRAALDKTTTHFLFFSSIYIFYLLSIYWLCGIFVAIHRLSLVVAGEGYSAVVVYKLLTAVASLVAEPRL